MFRQADDFVRRILSLCKQQLLLQDLSTGLAGTGSAPALDGLGQATTSLR